MVREELNKGKIKIKVKVLSDRLVRIIGKDRFLIEVSKKKYRFRDLIRIIEDCTPSIKEIVRDIGKTVFIAVNDKVYYNLEDELPQDHLKVTIFTVGAGG